MKTAKILAYGLFAFCVLGAITCFTMAIVFSYVPHLVYPEPIVNVRPGVQGSNMTQFHLRCDLAGDGVYRAQLLQDCGATLYAVEPDCNLAKSAGYWPAAFAFGQVWCPTQYLSHIAGTTVNLSVNLIPLASCMMILGGFLCCVPFFVLWCKKG